MWSKIIDHDHYRNFLINRGQMIEILTMARAKIHIFHDQNGKPKNFTTDIDHRMPILTTDHRENSRVLMVMVNFFQTIDHGANSRVSWTWPVPYPP